MTKDEALKLALEALEDACGDRCNSEYNPCFQREAITAIKQALAQPEEEPVIDQSAAVRIATVLGWTPPRQPLTQKEVDLILAKHELNYVRGKDRDDLLGAIRDIEAAHGIKGEA